MRGTRTGRGKRGDRRSTVHHALAELLEPRRLLSVGLINDINAVPTPSGSIGPFVDLNGTVVFSENDGIHGAELYKSNGTADTTLLIRDIAPAPGASSSPQQVTNVRGALFFSASSGLWRSDATQAGTTKIDASSSTISNPFGFVPGPGSRVLFLGSGNGGRIIWSTDGTSAGTQVVTQLQETNGTQLVNNVGFDDKLYYFLRTASTTDMWVTDGTASGTLLVKQFDDTSLDDVHVLGHQILMHFSNSASLWKFDGTTNVLVGGMTGVTFAGASSSTLYYNTDDTSDTRRLYAYDGTTLAPILNIPAPVNVLAVNGQVFFSVPAVGFYTSNGTLQGTHLVPGFGGPGQIAPGLISSVGDQLYFTAKDPANGLGGLYRSDGSAAGTTLIHDFPADYNGAIPGGFKRSGSLVYFTANDGMTGTEPWVSDGTAAGTHLLKDVFAGTGSADPKPLGVFKNRLYYFANDGVHGYEPWSTDGTPGGAALLKDLKPGPGNGSQTTADTGQATSRYLFFTGSDTSADTQLWRTDGTTAGTIKLAALKTINSWAAVGDTVFFTPDVITFKGLWMSDGSAAGTVRVPGGSAITYIYCTMDGVVYGTGTDAANGTELWRSDGTAAGTYRISDIASGGQSSYPSGLQPIGHTLYFFAQDQTGTSNLYQYSVAGDVALVKDINPGANDNAGGVDAVAGGKLFFSSNSASTGNELWVSDGTEQGTHLVKDLSPGSGSSTPKQIFALNDLVIFKSGSKLYRTDGTDAGTYPLGDIVPADDVLGTANFTLMGNFAYFAGMRNGVESIWRTDGSSGISMVADLPSNFSGWPSQRIAFNGSLYFTADNGLTGREFWTYLPDDPPLVLSNTSVVSVKGIDLAFNRPLMDAFPRSALVALEQSGYTSTITRYVAVTIDNAAGILHLNFPGFSGGILPDANYRIILPAGYVKDLHQNPLPNDVTVDFFILAGDANQDRRVDFADLVAVAQHYGASTTATLSQGDFNGDGAVDFTDLVTIAQNYGKTLPPPFPYSGGVPASASPVFAAESTASGHAFDAKAPDSTVTIPIHASKAPKPRPPRRSSPFVPIPPLPKAT